MEDKESKLKWLNGQWDRLVNDSEDRIEEGRKHLARYKNTFYRDVDTRTIREVRSITVGSSLTRKYNRIPFNHLKDLTDARIAKLTRFRPAITIIPPSNDYSDKVASKIAKKIVDYHWYINDMDRLNSNMSLAADVLSENFMFITWDPDRGPLHPDSDESGEMIAMLDSEGNKMKDESGKTTMIDSSQRIGDVRYDLALFDQVNMEPKKKFEDIDWVIWRIERNRHETIQEYPDDVEKIKDVEAAKVFDYDMEEENTVPGIISEYVFYHRPTKFFPKGTEVRWIRNALLKEKEYPYPTATLPGELPMVRLTFQEIPGQLNGVSFYRYTRALQDHYNNLSTMILRNQLLASHPKWMMPAGAADIKSLGNDITVVQFKGPVAPALVQSNPTPNESFVFRDKMLEEMQQLSTVFGQSRGEPPPGIKAGVALQFLNEQENERFNLNVIKYQKYIEDVARKTLKVIGNFYDDSDHRKMAIVGGRTGMDLDIIEFNMEQLKKDFDVRVQNSSSLPQSRSGRTQTIIDLNEAFPDMFTREQIVEMLDVSQSEKFIDAATTNVNSAESENDHIIESGKSIPPEPWEDHIVHYKIHIRALQDNGFRLLEKKVQDILKDHTLAHEMFIFRQSERNPLIAERVLKEIPSYPIFLDVEKLRQQLQAQGAPLVQPPLVEQEGIPQFAGGPPIPQTGPEQAVPGPQASPEVPVPGPLPAGEDAQPA